MNMNRRGFIKTSIAGAVGAALYGSHALAAHHGGKKRVVVVGGGIGGATTAKYIKKYDPSIDVTLIEPNPHYYTCFMSNEVLGGHRQMDSIRFDYEGLKKKGIRVVQDTVTDIDAAGQIVRTASGKTYQYDRCVVSPGVDFKYEAIPGYSKAVAESSIPHAWKAGPQTEMLRKQLEAMPDGGTFVMVPPPNPFRCPPGPYERVSQIASYFKEHKPNCKIVILDPKNKFSKFGLFMDGWKRHYGYGTDKSMITWIPADKGGKVIKIDPDTKTVHAEAGTFKADVLNIIPPQKAGAIAFKTGLTKGDWCPVDHMTFESTLKKNIHVVGDSSIASPLPKSGYAANSEAKICAAAIVSLLNGKKMPEPSWVNTCYSIIAPGDGISVAMVYAYENGKIIKVKGSGGLTGKYDPELRKREEMYAHSWFNNITADVFG
ncbi:NAD(P)/FAD-dependent oxidoreductase [Sulfurivirga sp.]|uniref:NAD(P)/FAD-dependent oxidoreductase n=1 Tax=Sulfurivirga sp. TaxID=2614236 RepID=UPI0025F1BFBA|nr:NAD(P)/FAD-dependent oxidoreductase [Sulfurivirga sp.]